MTDFLILQDLPTDDEKPFYCSSDCKRSANFKIKANNDPTMDHIQEYSHAVCYRGLLILLHRDAIRYYLISFKEKHNKIRYPISYVEIITTFYNRYGDGPRMMTLWKHNLLQYLDNSHPKYLIYAVRLLTSINGGVSQRLQAELLWNRTVNQNGGTGNNISMDLMIEFLNKGFKGTILPEYNL